jgi:hypothetical protein
VFGAQAVGAFRHPSLRKLGRERLYDDGVFDIFM